jgi:ppGpp synthetase/RelA/SpoT-type nucleotidyltranferase
MAINLGTIFLFLFLAIHFLVRRPIGNLVKKINKIEMGYWDQDLNVQGAWEFRWLAWRFWNMVNEVRTTVDHLLKAERKAHKNLHSKTNNPLNLPFASIQLQIPGPDHGNSIYYNHLVEKCRILETASLEDHNALKLAAEVMEKDIIEANRCGYRQLKNRLEDAALSILEPELFHSINQQLLTLIKSQGTWATKSAKMLCRVLEKNMIPCIDVSHRVKHTGSILQKMKEKKLILQEIHDLYAFRVIVPTESDCYSALGIIHQNFNPIVGRFKDYIVRPKINGYQSLHTCVSNKIGPVFEVQIRSAAMHQHADMGNSAHWLYKKEGSNKSTQHLLKNSFRILLKQYCSHHVRRAVTLTRCIAK